MSILKEKAKHLAGRNHDPHITEAKIQAIHSYLQEGAKLALEILRSHQKHRTGLGIIIFEIQNLINGHDEPSENPPKSA